MRALGLACSLLVGGHVDRPICSMLTHGLKLKIKNRYIWVILQNLQYSKSLSNLIQTAPTIYLIVTWLEMMDTLLKLLVAGPFTLRNKRPPNMTSTVMNVQDLESRLGYIVTDCNWQPSCERMTRILMEREKGVAEDLDTWFHSTSCAGTPIMRIIDHLPYQHKWC